MIIFRKAKAANSNCRGDVRTRDSYTNSSSDRDRNFARVRGLGRKTNLKHVHQYEFKHLGEMCVKAMLVDHKRIRNGNARAFMIKAVWANVNPWGLRSLGEACVIEQRHPWECASTTQIIFHGL